MAIASRRIRAYELSPEELEKRLNDSFEGVDEAILDDPDLFNLLVARAQRATVSDPGQTVIALLDEDQRQALVVGELTTWTQVDDEHLVAWLEVAGQQVALVPFVATGETWTFDLVGELQSSGGETS